MYIFLLPEFALMSSAAAYLQADAACIASFTHIAEVPLVVKDAKGCFLFDADGNKYLDLTSGACTMNMGYGRTFAGSFGSFPFPYAVGTAQIDYARALLAHFPGGSQGIKLSYGVCGSEAIDGAIKLCRASTGRKRILTFEGDYHGTTFGAVSLTSLPGRISSRFAPLLPEVYVLPFCSEKATAEDIEHCMQQLRELDNGDIAGIITEPVQGDMGMLPMHPELMQQLYAYTREHGIALVSDEIQMAFGRTGPFFSIENYKGVIPDAVVMGKHTGGGIPLSCIMGKASFMDSLSSCEHAFSMAGNAEACMRGLTLLRELEQPEFQAALRSRQQELIQGLKGIKERYPEAVTEITGLGLAYGLWLADDMLCRQVIRYCFEHGVYVMRLGSRWVRLEPPFVITAAELSAGLEVLEEAIAVCSNHR